jgi:hypothetical protein
MQSRLGSSVGCVVETTLDRRAAGTARKTAAQRGLWCLCCSRILLRRGTRLRVQKVYEWGDWIGSSRSPFAARSDAVAVM